MTSNSEVFQNPLVAWQPDFIRTWADWQKLWSATNLFELRHGLLHCGFRVHTEDPKDDVDRLLFYLELADGHNSFERQGGDGWSNTYRQHKTALGDFKDEQSIREALAEKAYQVLAMSFFKLNEHSGHLYWACNHADPRILEALIHFFRIYRGGMTWDYRFVNARDDSPADTAAKNFAYAMCRHVWNPKYADMPHIKDVELMLIERFKAHRPQLARIMCGLGQYDRFFETTSYPMDHRTLLMLKNMAVERDPLLPTDRLCWHRKGEWHKLESAVASGSPVARAFNNLLVAARETKRRKRITEAEAAAKQAAARLAALRQ